MAHQIVEEAHGSRIYMIGINERGYSLAGLLKSSIDKIDMRDTPLKRIKSTDNEPIITFPTPEKVSVLVIVDDVIFSAGTMFKVLNRIKELNDFQKIYTAVLVDRGHRKYPVLASIVGMNIPTKLNEQVELKLINGKPDEVVLLKN
jgi:pyrimidine operon attenuation protein/uracil phosphoribosyltransferase